MVINLLILLVGLFLVVKGSDFFVRSATSIAKKLGVSEFVLGLTLIALGTSLPELVSSIIASLKHEGGFVVGTIIGANIANVGLVIGLVAAISIIKMKREVLKRDVYIMVFVSVAFGLFMLDLSISRIEGVILLLFYFSYITFLFDRRSKFKEDYEFSGFLRYFTQFKFLSILKRHPASRKKKNHRKISIRDIIILIIGGVMLYFGASYVVKEAIFIAENLNVPAIVIGVLVAIGTTMPEMSVALTAIRKGYGNIAVGNSVGSWITNTLLVIGVSAIIFPLKVMQKTLYLTIPFLVFTGVLFAIFVRTGWKLSKPEGIILIVLYIVFLLSMLLGFLG